MSRVRVWLTAVFCLACGPADPVEMGDPPVDLIATIAAQADLSTFRDVIEASPVEGTLTAPGPLTIFAPTDAAFGSLPPGRLEEILADPGLAGATVLSHVTTRPLTLDALRNLDSFENGNNQTVSVQSANGSPTVGGAMLIRSDVRATNGILHVIDAVIIP